MANRLAFWLLTALIIAAPGAMAQQPVAAAKTADEVLAAYLRAVGGREKLLAMESLVQIGRISVQVGDKSMVGSLELVAKAPNKMLMVQRLPMGEARTGFDGKIAWTLDQKGQLRLIEGQEFQEIKNLAALDRFARYEEYFGKRELKKSQDLNGTPVYVLSLTPESGKPWTVFVDQRSMLIVGLQVGFETDAGAQNVVTLFSDYRRVEGYLIPFARVQRAGQLTMTFRADRVTVNGPVADAVFSVPDARQLEVLTDQ